MSRYYDYEEWEGYADGYYDDMEQGEEVEISFEKNEVDWEVPMNTEYMKDKKMDYEALGLLTLFSNYNHDEDHRYLYEKGSNSLYSNIDKMEELSGNKKRKIKRDIKKLAECDNEVVEICVDKDNRIYYKICPYACDEERMGHFVTINSRMLEFLINVGNSNVIKTYCAIKVLLWDKNRKCHIKRPLTREFLLKFIGLSNNGNNLQQMSDILDHLALCGFIEREEKVVKVKVNGETKVQTTYEYRLTTYEEWYKVKKELKCGVTKLLRANARKKEEKEL